MKSPTVSRRTVLTGGGALAASLTLQRAHNATAQGMTWIPLVTDGSGPAPRWDHHLGADEENQQLLLYGGRDANGVSLNDTWVFDIASTSWSQLEVEAPAPRFGSATAEDRTKRRLYLFGGEDGATFYNDTWRFDFKSMTWRLQTGGEPPAPTPRYGFGGVLDADDNFVVSHGFTFEGRFDDTWVFDTRGKSWLDVSAAPEARPLKRCLHAMTRDPEQDTTILFGGCSSGFGPCPQGDLWAMEGSSGLWTNITPGAGPAARSDPAMVWDSVGTRALLFGGLTEVGQVADLWEGTLADGAFTWTELVTEGDLPAARSSHAMVELGGSVFLFGGTGPTGVFNDVWQLEL